jgi:hypothetical protein
VHIGQVQIDQRQVKGLDRCMPKKRLSQTKGGRTQPVGLARFFDKPPLQRIIFYDRNTHSDFLFDETKRLRAFIERSIQIAKFSVVKREGVKLSDSKIFLRSRRVRR